jgi:hypothetical protein
MDAMTRHSPLLPRRLPFRAGLGLLLAGSLALLGACAGVPTPHNALSDPTPSSSQAADT